MEPRHFAATGPLLVTCLSVCAAATGHPYAVLWAPAVVVSEVECEAVRLSRWMPFGDADMWQRKCKRVTELLQAFRGAADAICVHLVFKVVSSGTAWPTRRSARTLPLQQPKFVFAAMACPCSCGF
jgi:hypothetical protein